MHNLIILLVRIADCFVCSECYTKLELCRLKSAGDASIPGAFSQSMFGLRRLRPHVMHQPDEQYESDGTHSSLP